MQDVKFTILNIYICIYIYYEREGGRGRVRESNIISEANKQINCQMFLPSGPLKYTSCQFFHWPFRKLARSPKIVLQIFSYGKLLRMTRPASFIFAMLHPTLSRDDFLSALISFATLALEKYTYYIYTKTLKNNRYVLHRQ